MDGSWRRWHGGQNLLYWPQIDWYDALTVWQWWRWRRLKRRHWNRLIGLPRQLSLVMGEGEGGTLCPRIRNFGSRQVHKQNDKLKNGWGCSRILIHARPKSVLRSCSSSDSEIRGPLFHERAELSGRPCPWTISNINGNWTINAELTFFVSGFTGTTDRLSSLEREWKQKRRALG